MEPSEKNSHLKIYLISAGVGLGAYLFTPLILDFIANRPGNNFQNIEQALARLAEHETQQENRISNIESNIASANNVVGQAHAMLSQQENLSQPQLAKRRYSLRELYPYTYQDYPASLPNPESFGTTLEPQLPVQQFYPRHDISPTINSYPSHDIYFAWEAEDRGVDRARRAYKVSFSSNGIIEGIGRLASKFKELFRKQ